MEPDRLAHVFFNVIHNAVQAMPEGGKIFMRFATTPTNLQIEIEDTGHGIAPEVVPRLFEPFATFFQTLAEANCSLLHPFVRFARTAEKHHLFGTRHPLLAIGVIQPNAEDPSNGLR